MKLVLDRYDRTDTRTIGKVSINGEWFGYCLEDAIRPVKIPGETAIPFGRYQVVITFSQRFQRDLPILLEVPNFQGVRIHPGNTTEDTEGCILVGMRRGKDTIFESKRAVEALTWRMRQALAAGDEVWLDIPEVSVSTLQT